MQSKRNMVDLLGKWVEDEILPQPFFPDEHPLLGVVSACGRALRELEALAAPGTSVRWVGSVQALYEAPPGLVTKCIFEMDGADEQEAYATKVWLESRLEQLLDGLPNLVVEVVCRS